MTTPLVSILLPVYNAELYLKQAIESILSQSLEDLELIIINDGSTDSSLDILEKFRESDSRIRLFSRQNKGLISTLNEGLGYCKGKYIARMDADDISLPNRLQTQVNFLDRTPDCVAVGSKVLLIDPDGMPICPFSTKLNHEEIDEAHLTMQGGAITHPVVMLRAEAVMRIGGYRQEYLHAEDLDLFLRLAEIGRLANLPETFLMYRMHLTSIGHSQRDIQQKSAYKAVNDACFRRNLTCQMAKSRPPSNKKSALEIHVKWAWWALNAGNKNTARKHAWYAFRRSPLTIKNIKVLLCAIRGY